MEDLLVHRVNESGKFWEKTLNRYKETSWFNLKKLPLLLDLYSADAIFRFEMDCYSAYLEKQTECPKNTR